MLCTIIRDLLMNEGQEGKKIMENGDNSCE